ncbi:MAG: ComEA family DNA-binding protein, partial [Ginsengibacter sp.]
RKGVIYIVCIIFLLIVSQFLFSLFNRKTHYSHDQFADEISKLQPVKADSVSEKSYSKNAQYNFDDDYSEKDGKNYEVVKSEVFYFDPNTASAADWKRLGIRDKTIHTIQNYLSKGGKFYKPEDISKIWGLPSTDAKRLIPYVSIKNKTKEYTPFEKKEYSKNLSNTSKTIQLVDVNLADTAAFINLPGIGSKLSQRIITFRTKLGGFYSIDQVGETYLLPDSTFQKIKQYLVIGNTPVKQININAASVDEMKSHPYLRYNLANAIFQYRNQHGNFNSIEEIKKVILVTEEIFKKIAPYLTLK